MTNGRNSDATFFSPLKQINTATVSRLGFAWQFKTATYRGMEATPLVVDGVLYVSGIWGIVYAVDASTGSHLWTFDPHSDPSFARWSGVDVTTRGLAVWKGKVYGIATDCRLFALDARTGQIAWQTETLVEKTPGYVCSGAPQVAGKFVVVGNAGGENGQGGVRGYVSAFDLESGRLAWRFYTVPSLNDKNPTPELRRAQDTWDPRRNPSFGGGGTVWGLMAYDPDLDLLYFGTGNAAPYSAPRDWSGGTRTDFLYAASIIALRASTGRMAWYYQTTPGDIWDYDATMSIVLAQLTIDGTKRRVLMQANKNGYFYVIDRKTGRPISVEPFAYMNWSTGMDKSFRPIVSKESGDYAVSPKIMYPSVYGAHNWQPMSFSPASGLVYIPAIETGNILADLRTNPGSQLSDLDQAMAVTQILPDKSLSYDLWESMAGRLPRFPVVAGGGKPLLRAVLKAWDPVTGHIVWEQQTSQDYFVLDGGALSTAGGLVFAGREDGRFIVYEAATGKVLKEIDTGSAMMAAPMTYAVNGKQYVSVLCGHGGEIFNFLGTAAMRYINEGRILTFALDGVNEVPRPAVRPEALPYGEPPPRVGSPELVMAGRNLFFIHCARCHSFDVPAMTPDLSRMSDRVSSIDAFKAVILKGALLPLGMPRFDDILSEGDAYALHSYLVDQSWALYEAHKTSDKNAPH